jgi:DNA repair protein RecN (Recombination protein N)
MLIELRVKNYALIDNLTFCPGNDLNVITGETGSGKSIMLGALGLILGERAETGVLKVEDQKCVIEGQFDISALELKDFFVQNDLDYENLTIVRREISAGGKSRAFINDTPVNLNILKQLGESLVDIHTQHQSIELFEQQKQLTMLDAFAQNTELLKSYKSAFKHWQSAKIALTALTERKEKNLVDRDFKEFQLSELLEAQIEKDETVELESENEWLENAQEVKSVLQESTYLLEGSDESIENALKLAIQKLAKIKKGAALETLKERLQSAAIELKDIADTLAQEEEATIENPERLEWVQNRLTLLYQLMKKHRVEEVSELLKIQNVLSAELEENLNLDVQISQQEQICNNAFAQCSQLALTLEQKRGKGKLILEEKITEKLQKLALPHAQLKIDLVTLDELNESGKNKALFLFSANKGIEPQPLSKVASGGELSRMMLVLKSLLAEVKSLPTLIFDEVDSGISGQVALLTANLIADLSINMQIVCITHLPQMASKGHSHFLVYKNDECTPPQTEMKRLNDNERLVEIAQMISGINPGEKAIANAKELLGIS